MAKLDVLVFMSKINGRKWAGTRLESKINRQGGSGEYKLSKINAARGKMERQLDLVEYSRIRITDSVHLGNPLAGYLEILKIRTQQEEFSWHQTTRKLWRVTCRH